MNDAMLRFAALDFELKSSGIAVPSSNHQPIRSRLHPVDRGSHHADFEIVLSKPVVEAALETLHLMPIRLQPFDMKDHVGSITAGAIERGFIENGEVVTEGVLHGKNLEDDFPGAAGAMEAAKDKLGVSWELNAGWDGQAIGKTPVRRGLPVSGPNKETGKYHPTSIVYTGECILWSDEAAYPTSVALAAAFGFSDNVLKGPFAFTKQKLYPLTTQQQVLKAIDGIRSGYVDKSSELSTLKEEEVRDGLKRIIECSGRFNVEYPYDPAKYPADALLDSEFSHKFGFAAAAKNRRELVKMDEKEVQRRLDAALKAQKQEFQESVTAKKIEGLEASIGDLKKAAEEQKVNGEKRVIHIVNILADSMKASAQSGVAPSDAALAVLPDETKAEIVASQQMHQKLNQRYTDIADWLPPEGDATRKAHMSLVANMDDNGFEFYKSQLMLLPKVTASAKNLPGPGNGGSAAPAAGTAPKEVAGLSASSAAIMDKIDADIKAEKESGMMYGQMCVNKQPNQNGVAGKGGDK